MTTNSINYNRHLEDVRSHKAGESENFRSNLAREIETNRHNLATEYLSRDQLIEQARSNRANEALKRAGYSTQLASAGIAANANRFGSTLSHLSSLYSANSAANSARNVAQMNTSASRYSADVSASGRERAASISAQASRDNTWITSNANRSIAEANRISNERIAQARNQTEVVKSIFGGLTNLAGSALKIYGGK